MDDVLKPDYGLLVERGSITWPRKERVHMEENYENIEHVVGVMNKTVLHAKQRDKLVKAMQEIENLIGFGWSEDDEFNDIMKDVHKAGAIANDIMRQLEDGEI